LEKAIDRSTEKGDEGAPPHREQGTQTRHGPAFKARPGGLKYEARHRPRSPGRPSTAASPQPDRRFATRRLSPDDPQPGTTSERLVLRAAADAVLTRLPGLGLDVQDDQERNGDEGAKEDGQVRGEGDSHAFRQHQRRRERDRGQGLQRRRSAQGS